MKKVNIFRMIVPAVVVISILSISSCTVKTNWPQFRGPENNMVATGKNLPDEWSTDKNIRWTFALTGNSWSSPIVWGNKVFIASAFPEESVSGSGLGTMPQRPPAPPANPPGSVQNPSPPPPPPQDAKSYLNDIFRWEITCLDLKTGEELWKKVAKTGNPRIKVHAGATYANETPVTDGKRIYVYFGMTGLFCYDLEGNLLWQKDLGVYDTRNGWGTGSSPVIYQDILYIQVDNEVNSFLTALDAATGEQKWKVDRDEKTIYSTPVIWKNKVRTELVTTGKTARSYDPATGKVLWELKLGGEYSVPSPVADSDRIYLGNASGREAKGTLFCVKAGAEGDITPSEGETTSIGVEWSVADAGTGNPSPLLYDGLIYILGSRGGEIRCYEAETGNTVYKEKVDNVGACWASPWVKNDKLFFCDEKGVTQVIKAGKQFEVISRNDLNDKIWSSVAITGNAYLFKGVKQLYCVSSQ